MADAFDKLLESLMRWSPNYPMCLDCDAPNHVRIRVAENFDWVLTRFVVKPEELVVFGGIKWSEARLRLLMLERGSKKDCVSGDYHRCWHLAELQDDLKKHILER